MAVAVGFATTASAATLTVESLDSANVPQNTFHVGDTINLKVTGDSQGGTTYSIYGQLFYNAAIAHGIAVAQSPMYSTQFAITTGGFCGDLVPPPPYQCATVFNQFSGGVAPRDPILISTLTLIADATGVSNVGFGGSVLTFFDIYEAKPTNGTVRHTFTIVPEPATVALIGLALLGLARWRRRLASSA